MSARKDFENQMKKMQEKAKKPAPQNSTEALISSFEEASVKSPGKKNTPEPVYTEHTAVSAPVVRSRTIKQQLGRPKKYVGEQEIITIKVPKDIKDKVRIAAAANRMSLVDYMMYIVENDFNEHHDEYVK